MAIAEPLTNAMQPFCQKHFLTYNYPISSGYNNQGI
jgi:hypothetical protein